MKRWTRRAFWSTSRFFASLVIRFSAKAGVIVAAIMISLSFTIASFAVPTLAHFMSSLVARTVGTSAVVASSEIRDLRHQIQTLENSKENLMRRNRTLAARNNRLGAENRRLAIRTTRLSDQLAAHRSEAAALTRRIGQRAARTTTRSVASIPIESVPFLGIATTIAVTAWEVRDTCQTLDDMAALQENLGLEPDTSLARNLCNNSLLQTTRASHYGSMTESECRAEAEGARAGVFELATLAGEDEIPDLVADETDFDAEITEVAEREFAAISEICDCIADLSCDPDELAMP